jgi:hypothetical protein
VAGAAIERDQSAPLLIARCNLLKRGAGPGNLGRGVQRRLWLARRPGIGGNSDRPTDRVPGVKRRTALLISCKDDKAQDKRNADQHSHGAPADPRPGIINPEWTLVADHHYRPLGLERVVTSTAGTVCCLRKKNCPIG